MSLPLSTDLSPLTGLFKALSDQTRLRIVALLAHGELCVCHLEDALSLPQPTVSRHLAVLRAAQVVASRREGSWVYYRLAEQNDEASRQQLEQLVARFAHHATLGQEVKRLVRATGPGACAAPSSAASRGNLHD